MNIGIVGGGRGGLAILKLLLTIPSMTVLWVSDVQADAPAVLHAQEFGIATTNDFLPLVKNTDLEMVVEVTGSGQVRGLLNLHKHEQLTIIDATAAKLLITIVDNREELAHHITQKAAEMAALISQLNEFSLLIQKNMQHLANEAEKFAEFAETLAATSRTATAQADQTQEILGIIDGITKTSRIIGLNASIEASRVGKAGAGFAVVASEIRHLAESTGESTQKISEITSTVKDYMHSIHDGIGEAKTIAHAQATATEETLAALESLAETSERLRQLSADLMTLS